jgi:2-keto-3-deoxy-L-rhamnonate aldolase RhmA
MQWIDRTRLATEQLAGTFLNLASANSVQIAAQAGFDWLLLDLEHGGGHFSDLRSLLNATNGTAAAPIVRLPSVDADLAKFALDSGAAGIMFPFVNSAAEAKRAVDICNYPPQGHRGTASVIRATDYGTRWRDYFAEANQNTLVVVQMETEEAINNIDSIAAVDGVDVLFVGPLDLSVSLGVPGQFTHDAVVAAMQAVIDACLRHARVPGILSRPDLIDDHKTQGFRFLALGSDAGAVVAGMAASLAGIRGTH